MRIIPNALALALLTAAGAAGEAPRIGDPESVFDPAKFDARFPQSKVWAEAGVQGGIPHRSSLPIVATLKPGDDIGAAVAKAGKGVVLLGEGTWKLSAPIQLRSHVVIRGAGMDKTKLEYHRGGNVMSGKGIERFGIEDLSIECSPPGGAKMGDGIVLMECRNGWIQNTRISRTAWRPIRMGGCRNLTCRDNITEFALDQGSGSGYYEILDDSTANLFYNDTLIDLRHISIHWAKNERDRTTGPGGNVFVHLNLIDCDINLHGSDAGNNLFEAATIDAKDHKWVPISHGVSRYGMHHPGLDGNLFYKLSAVSKDGGANSVYGHTGMTFPDNPDGTFVYSIRSVWSYPLVYPIVAEPPRSGTFYPVTGVHRLLPGQQRGELTKRIVQGPPVPWPASATLPAAAASLTSIAEIFADCPVRSPPTTVAEQVAFRSWLRAKNRALANSTLTITGTYNNGTGNITADKTPGFAVASINPGPVPGVFGTGAEAVVICTIATANGKAYQKGRGDSGRYTVKGRITAVQAIAQPGKSMIWVELQGTEADNPPPGK